MDIAIDFFANNCREIPKILYFVKKSRVYFIFYILCFMFYEIPKFPFLDLKNFAVPLARIPLTYKRPIDSSTNTRKKSLP